MFSNLRVQKIITKFNTNYLFKRQFLIEFLKIFIILKIFLKVLCFNKYFLKFLYLYIYFSKSHILGT